MQDDKLKELFSDFQPELASTSRFMEKLQRNMEAVEIVRQYTHAQRKRNRIAMTVAALSGFITGVIMTLLFPLFRNWISTFSFSLDRIPHISGITVNYDIIGWIIMAAVCVLTTLNIYEITLNKLTPKEKPF